MFKKIKDRLQTLEAVLDAVVEILHEKTVLTREEIQVEILKRSTGRKTMKKRCFLHELPRHGGVKIYGYDIQGEPEGTAIIFDSLDGLYSVCHIENKPDKIVHLSATVPLIRYKDGYREDGV